MDFVALGGWLNWYLCIVEGVLGMDVWVGRGVGGD